MTQIMIQMTVLTTAMMEELVLKLEMTLGKHLDYVHDNL